jgi:hypothetical protein
MVFFFFCVERSYSWRQLWANFYGLKPHLPLFEDVVKVRKSGNRAALSRYKELNKDRLFDNVAYKKRVTVSIETLLLEVRIIMVYICIYVS